MQNLRAGDPGELMVQIKSKGHRQEDPVLLGRELLLLFYLGLRLIG